MEVSEPKNRVPPFHHGFFRRIFHQQKPSSDFVGRWVWENSPYKKITKNPGFGRRVMVKTTMGFLLVNLMGFNFVF